MGVGCARATASRYSSCKLHSIERLWSPFFGRSEISLANAPPHGRPNVSYYCTVLYPLYAETPSPGMILAPALHGTLLLFLFSRIKAYYAMRKYSRRNSLTAWRRVAVSPWRLEAYQNTDCERCISCCTPQYLLGQTSSTVPNAFFFHLTRYGDG